MKQLTKEQAIKFYESNVWKDWSDEEIVRFQLFQRLMSVPFSQFHKSMEAVLNRSIWTHEFAYWDDLKKEYLGVKSKPTFDEIINLIPEEKRIIITK